MCSSISPLILSPFLQTKVENEEAIADVIRMVENTQNSLLDSAVSAFDPLLVTSPEGKQRIEEMLR
jgi:hypothetical protein